MIAAMSAGRFGPSLKNDPMVNTRGDGGEKTHQYWEGRKKTYRAISSRFNEHPGKDHDKSKRRDQ